MTKSFTFNGTLDTSYEAWERWIKDALAICDGLGYIANYYSVSLAGEFSGKIHPISGLARKMANTKKKGVVINAITILVLPENFSSAIFDYVITLSRNASHIHYLTLVINDDYKMNIDEPTVTDVLRGNISADSGEIYEIDIHDCPELYAAKGNSEDYWKSKSLRVIAPLTKL